MANFLWERSPPDSISCEVLEEFGGLTAFWVRWKAARGPGGRRESGMRDLYAELGIAGGLLAAEGFDGVEGVAALSGYVAALRELPGLAMER